MRLYSAEEMTRADRRAQELGIPGAVLMERAAVEMTRAIVRRFGPAGKQRVLAVCGGGNNGGDGFVIARELRRLGARVSVLPVSSEYRGDARTNLEILKNLDVRFIYRAELGIELERANIVVDALLGTGFSGKVREDVAEVIERINTTAAHVVSVDVPSGVNGSTGEVGGVAVRARLTICAHAVKVGCAVSPGRECAGQVEVVEIGIPSEAEVEPSAEWTDAASLRGLVPLRPATAHKYSAGSLLVVAGSRQATGAAVMAVRGAQRAGCGIIFSVTSESAAPFVDAQLTEALVAGAPEDDGGYMTAAAVEAALERTERATAMVVGPAVGVGDESRELVERLLSEVDLPVLLDADAVTNLAGSGALACRAERGVPTIITPHPGEMGRLLGVGAKEIAARRLHYARQAAEEHGCCVLLKGPGTIVVDDGRVSVNASGSAALATAGTGDVLSGVIGGLLSRGMDAYGAARAGAWAHGRAAELWAETTGWPEASMVATDLLEHLPRAFGELL